MICQIVKVEVYVVYIDFDIVEFDEEGSWSVSASEVACEHKNSKKFGTTGCKRSCYMARCNESECKELSNSKRATYNCNRNFPQKRE